MVRRIHENLEQDYDVLTFLESKGVVPGAKMLVIEVLEFNETIHLCVDSREVILGLRLASDIYVSEFE